MLTPVTLLVGLDAACWEYVEPLLEAGGMPVLQSLIEEGVAGVLESTMPPWTPSAWATLATGKLPGKHGVFDMLFRRPGTYAFLPTSNRIRRGTPFWQRLNQMGLRVGLVNVPFTYPPEPLAGFVVAGFGTPETARDITYPGELLANIEKNVGRYAPVVSAELLRSGSPEVVLAEEIAHQAQLVDIAIHLATVEAVDVLVINLMLTDHANHKMPEMDQVHEAYVAADKDLGRLITAINPQRVMLISDHGSSRQKGDFLLNLWLRDHGYLVYTRRDRAEQAKALNWLLVQWLQEYRGWSGRGEKGTRGIIRELLMHSPRRVREAFFRRLDKIIPLATEHVLFHHEIDFGRSRVFPGSVYSGLLYLNVIGREPEGTIPVGEKVQIVEELISQLEALVDPDTGRRVMNRVCCGQEIYGENSQLTPPDIVLDAYEGDWNIRTANYVPTAGGNIRHTYFADARSGGDFGWHSREGLFVFQGEGFISSTKRYRGHLVDIPATLLHLHGAPIPADFDGTVLTDLLSASARSRPVRYQPGDPPEPGNELDMMDGENADQVIEHLRALGYLE